MRKVTTTLVALSVSVLVSCESQLAVEVGEVITYKHSPRLTPCGGTFAYLDAYAAYAAEQLAVSDIDEQSITYHWITSDIVDVADLGDSGCEARQGGKSSVQHLMSRTRLFMPSPSSLPIFRIPSLRKGWQSLSSLICGGSFRVSRVARPIFQHVIFLRL